MYEKVIPCKNIRNIFGSIFIHRCEKLVFEYLKYNKKFSFQCALKLFMSMGLLYANEGVLRCGNNNHNCNK